MRSWPAIEAGRLRAAATDTPADAGAGFSDVGAGFSDVGAGFSRPDPDLFQAALTDFDVAAIDETTPDA